MTVRREADIMCLIYGLNATIVQEPRHMTSRLMAVSPPGHYYFIITAIDRFYKPPLPKLECP